MIQAIAAFLGQILFFIYENTGRNYGIAIILLTLLTRVVTWPLTTKQLGSAKAMQDLQPEIKKIQEKYKNDKEKLNQETMALWKKHKVNPAAGCLPLIVQFPILIAIFHLLRQPELIPGIQNFRFIGMDMRIALVSPEGIWVREAGYYLLVAFSGITTYLQQKIMMTDKSQQAFMIFMPLMILYFSIRFPAGLILYWVLNNVLSVAHHYWMIKQPAKGALEGK